ncbi:hypothetical protein TNCV_2404151 [Trichonephila clavipes]|nr:hypothetical protein TNCV_2404151 [Trichonephila clavipes]
MKSTSSHRIRIITFLTRLPGHELETWWTKKRFVCHGNRKAIKHNREPRVNACKFIPSPGAREDCRREWGTKALVKPPTVPTS